MGGCASRPKADDNDLPVEAPSTTEKDQLETPSQEENNNDGGDQNQNENPLVVLSEPEPEPEKADAAAEPVPAETAQTTEAEVKAPAENADEVKVEATNNDIVTNVPAKEAGEAKKSDAAAPGKEEDKNDAPVVTL